MPDATVSRELHHYDLKTLEGGWIKLRQLSYYEMLERRDKSSRLTQSTEFDRKTGRPTNSKSETVDVKTIIETLNMWEREYTFKNCIAEHNLTDSNGVALNFSSPQTLRMLNPKIAFEIEKLIDDLNSEGDEFQEDFPNAPSNYSELHKQEQQTLETTDTQTS